MEGRPDKKLPTRLLQIGFASDDSAIYLVIGDRLPHNTPYATLSHCWGGKLPIKLTTKNLKSYTQRIPVEDLTVKFRQAVKVTREIGINYLWIDSLCILQDSKDDWENESSLMGDVYEGATINIAAASASDSDDPLFSNTSQDGFLDCFVHVPHMSDNPFLCCDEGIWHNNINVSPLLRRAWVLQELLLAPRILYFCRNQMFWECSEFQACEQWPNGLPERITAAEQTIRLPRRDENHAPGVNREPTLLGDHFIPLRLKKTNSTSFSHKSHNLDTERTRCGSLFLVAILSTLRRRRKMGGAPNISLNSSDRRVRTTALLEQLAEEDKQDLRHLWPEIIRRYSRAKLSFPEQDKLAAISAVAKRLYPLQTKNYLAGLWRDQMPSCLAWRAIGFVERPTGYQAPSWSWASVNGPVRIASCGAYNPHLRASVIQGRTKSPSKDPTGRVSGGSILLHTTMLKLECRNPRKSTYFVDPDRFANVTLCQAGSCHLRLYPDCMHPQLGDTIHLMVLEASVGDRETPQDYIYGLLISPTGKRGVYQRTGYFEVCSTISVDVNDPCGKPVPLDDEDGKARARKGSFWAFIRLCREFYKDSASLAARRSVKNQLVRSDVKRLMGAVEFRRSTDKVQVPGFIIELV